MYLIQYDIIVLDRGVAVGVDLKVALLVDRHLPFYQSK
ncbi:hypothetical protein MNB_SV-6-1589 [hydrothermal vent metagenome]|uniref:Uncharacterized protein n=1 Tax=hydrothermal vent metagenome TaxID=652676 RepID=A0A1W1C3C1_9ZZZZ